MSGRFCCRRARGGRYGAASVAFLILVPLAVTSDNVMLRRLGGAAWQTLDKRVYTACALAAIHFLMLVKSWTAGSGGPLIYAGLVAGLLYSGWPFISAGGWRARRQ